MGSPRIRPTIIEYFLGNPDSPISITRVCNDTGFTYQQVQSAIYNIIRNGNLPGLVALNQGSLWQYGGADATDEHGSIEGPIVPEFDDTAWYYEIGRTVQGHPIVRTETDATLYVLRHLEG